MTLPYQQHQKESRTQQGKEGIGTSSFSSIFQLFRNRPFWIWDKREHKQECIKTDDNCCFNHIVGLPIKNGEEYPIFDYEKLIFDAIEDNQNIWIKKARGIGVTTFLIRYLAWKVLYSEELDDKSIFIISGTREEFANYVKKKMEDLFLKRFPTLVLESKYTELWIKKTWIKVIPTRNIKDVRGYMDAAYLFIDEADHGDKQFQQELEPAIMAYEEKSKGKTIMVSTPNAPGGLFERIERDKDSKYTKLFLDYSYGLRTIYDPAYIARKKLEPDFPREYDLAYLGIIGNTFHVKDIERAVQLGTYDPNRVIVGAEKILGLDPGWGSSAFGVVLVQVADGQIQVLLADEYERPRYEDMISTIMDIVRGLNRRNIDKEDLGNCKIYVDAANPEFISTLKREVGETTRWDFIEEKILYCKKHNLDLARYMTVVPVPFNQEGKNMIMHTKELLEFDTLLIAINPKFDKLITSLRTAISSDDGKLDKEQTSYHNVLDAFRLALKGIKLVKKQID
jgi:hypothetical protein